MGFVEMITGRKSDLVERFEGDLAALNAQGATLRAEIERLGLVQADADSSDEVLGAMAAAQVARNKLRKLDGRIADARENLANARDAAREARIRELQAEFQAAAEAYLADARRAGAAFDRTVAAREAIQAEGFRKQYAALPVPPSIGRTPLLAQDLLSVFENAVRPAHRSPSAPKATPATPKRAPAPRQNSAVSLAPAPTPREPKRTPRRESAAEGERLFMMIRGIVDHPRKGLIQSGDVVAMTPDEAAPFIRSGSGDFVTAEEVAAIDAANLPPANANDAADVGRALK